VRQNRSPATGRACGGWDKEDQFLRCIRRCDQHGEYEAADEFEYGVLADFRPEDSGNVRVAVAFILVVGKFPEDCAKSSYERAPHRLSVKRFTASARLPLYALVRASFDACYIYELVFRDGDADASGQFHHGEFILGNRLIAG